MVLYCTTLHLIWSLLILSDPSTTGATPVAALAVILKSETALTVVLLLFSVLAVCGLFSRLPWMIVLMIPQQSLLLISAIGAVDAILSSQFADGVIRPQAFIAADQAHIILAAFGHAAAIVASSYERVG